MGYSIRSSGFRLFLLGTIAIAVWLHPGTTRGQAPASKNWVPPKTADGQPDLQGIWTNVTITPLERPPEFATKAFLTPAEAAAYEKQIVEANNADRRDGTAAADVSRAYNDFWWDRGTHVVKTL